MGGVRSIGSRKLRLQRRAETLPKKPKQERRPPPEFPAGHGERVWIFNHVTRGHVWFSLYPNFESKVLEQFPFTGKKLVPAKIRKDYVKPLAMVEFPEGMGDIGRDFYQKMREFKKRHELEWEDPDKLFALKKTRERGEELNDQRANCVADMAFVLSGAGKANQIWVKEEEGKKSRREKRHPAVVYWHDIHMMHNAESWPDNVTHVAGIPKPPKGQPLGKPVFEDQEGRHLEIVEEAKGVEAGAGATPTPVAA